MALFTVRGGAGDWLHDDQQALAGTEVQVKRMRARVDLLIQPPLESIGMLDWHALDEAEAGYRYTVELLGKTDHPLLALVQSSGARI